MKEKIVLYSVLALFTAYTLSTRVDYDRKEKSMLSKIEKESFKRDSLIDFYSSKIDSLNRSNDSLFTKLKKTEEFVSNSIEYIDGKTEIVITEEEIKEALSWLDTIQ